MLFVLAKLSLLNIIEVGRDVRSFSCSAMKLTKTCSHKLGLCWVVTAAVGLIWRRFLPR